MEIKKNNSDYNFILTKYGGYKFKWRTFISNCKKTREKKTEKNIRNNKTFYWSIFGSLIDQSDINGPVVGYKYIEILGVVRTIKYSYIIVSVTFF